MGSSVCSSNHVQWPRVRDELGLGQWFADLFVSHEVGLATPQAKIYQHVASALRVPLQEIAFFDDSRPNVEGAVNAGWSAYQVSGVEELRAQLGRPGCL